MTDKKEKPLSDLLKSVDIVSLPKTSLLVFRLGTDDIPASKAAIDNFELNLSSLFLRLDIDIPFMVVSSLVRVTAVSREEGKKLIDFNDPYGTEVIVDIDNKTIFHSPANNEKLYQKLKKKWADNAKLFVLPFPMTHGRLFKDDWSFIERSLSDMQSTRSDRG